MLIDYKNKQQRKKYTVYCSQHKAYQSHESSFQQSHPLHLLVCRTHSLQDANVALALHAQEDKSVHDTKNRYHNSDHLQGVGYGERLIKNPQYLFSQFPVTGNEYSLIFSELVSNERSCLVEIGPGLEIYSHRCVPAFFRPVAVKGGAVHDYHAALCAIIIEDTCNYKTLYAFGSWKFELITFAKIQPVCQHL